MNKWGVALAADSAVSITTSAGVKIYNTNKLFMLSKFHPVGIMVYGNAELMGVPWEVIIKKYRKEELKEECFKHLKDYGEHFLSYLNKNDSLFPQQQQENNIYATTYSYLDQTVNTHIKRAVEAFTHQGNKISDKQIQKIAHSVIKHSYEQILKLERLKALPPDFEKRVVRKYIKIFEEVIDLVFQKLPLSTVAYRQLKRICIALFSRDTSRIGASTSGIVIAGFGEDDLYPSFVSYEAECVVNDTLKYNDDRSAEIDLESTAALIPFAQQEMVVSFMAGISPDYRNILREYLSTVFDSYPDELIKEFPKMGAKQKTQLVTNLKQAGENQLVEFWKKVEDWAQENNVEKVLNAVSVLPKDELASMAMSLVNLTSFRRRVTMDAETVGGPIDVAVISKADGFIWIKRKHYFEHSDNPHFLTNYYR